MFFNLPPPPGHDPEALTAEKRGQVEMRRFGEAKVEGEEGLEAAAVEEGATGKRTFGLTPTHSTELPFLRESAAGRLLS